MLKVLGQEVRSFVNRVLGSGLPSSIDMTEQHVLNIPHTTLPPGAFLRSGVLYDGLSTVLFPSPPIRRNQDFVYNSAFLLRARFIDLTSSTYEPRLDGGKRLGYFKKAFERASDSRCLWVIYLFI